MSTVKTDIYFDAQNECIVIRRLDGAGEVIEDVPQIRLSLVDLQNAGQPDEMPIQAVFRRVHYTDAVDGSKKRCYGLLTIPEDDSEDDGHPPAHGRQARQPAQAKARMVPRHHRPHRPPPARNRLQLTHNSKSRFTFHVSHP